MKWYEKIFSNFSKNYYNRKSAKELGWKPDWFGELTYSKKLSQKISKFQKCYGLRVTGVVDERTWRKFQQFTRVINRIRYKTNKE
jgi:peptidoglycan hydrolase-like protein with peptidoglycan-binding domain